MWRRFFFFLPQDAAVLDNLLTPQRTGRGGGGQGRPEDPEHCAGYAWGHSGWHLTSSYSFPLAEIGSHAPGLATTVA